MNHIDQACVEQKFRSCMNFVNWALSADKLILIFKVLFDGFI